MSAENFPRSLAKVLVYEGGYSNDAGDPGGATMWGITHIDYDAYRKMKGLAPQDVRSMTTAERDDIYRNKYWVRPRCDELPSGVDFVVFDGAVNSGIAQSLKWLQRAVGVVADGAMGDVTMAAVIAYPDKAELVNKICDQRLRFLQALKTWPRFGGGWGKRVANVRATGLSWVVQNPEAPVADGGGKAIGDDVVTEDFSAKAVASDAQKTTVSPEISTTVATSSGIGSGLLQPLQDASSSLQPLSYTIKWVGYILAAIAVIGAIYTIYALYKRNKTKEALS